MTIELTHFASRAGDHNDRAMAATPLLTAVLSETLATHATVIGEPTPAAPTNWDVELAFALPALQRMSAHYDELLTVGHTPVTVLSRCSVALATLPMIAKHHPDAVVLWFDAHADLNTPENTATGYLGGMALSGPLGFWNSGLGDGLADRNVILVGARDIDPVEEHLLDAGRIALVPVSTDLAEDLHCAIAGRPVYVHIDCDVLEPGTVPTDYTVPAGMALAQLDACARALTDSVIIGLEIGELESADPQAPGADRPARLLAEALRPVLETLTG